MAQKTELNLFHYPNNSLLVSALAEQIGQKLQHAIDQCGQATLAVSGGSTPVPLFQQLSNTDIQWAEVVVTLVDERWVDADHCDSNAGLVKKYLLQNQASEAVFLGLKVDTNTPLAGQQAIAERLSQFDAAFDVVILGMGEDGHTASLFSNSERLRYALQPENNEPCCAITRSDLEHPRITLTLPRILNARQIYVHTVGATKLEVLQQASEAGAVNELPMRAVLDQTQTPVDVYHADE